MVTTDDWYQAVGIIEQLCNFLFAWPLTSKYMLYFVMNIVQERTLLFNNSKLVSIVILGGCPFNGRPLSGMKYPTRESPPRDAASPITYNGLRVRTAAVCAQPGVPYRDIIDWPAVLCCQRLQEASRVNINSNNANSP